MILLTHTEHTICAGRSYVSSALAWNGSTIVEAVAFGRPIIDSDWSDRNWIGTVRTTDLASALRAAGQTGCAPAIDWLTQKIPAACAWAQDYAKKSILFGPSWAEKEKRSVEDALKEARES
jgi:hypothetical protein